MSENDNYTEDDKFLAERPRKRRRRSSGAGYIYLFIFVFALAFFAMTKMVESYSPDVDVQIGNKQEITLNDDDMNFEARPIDERLRWIQSEDDIPAAGKHGAYRDDSDMTWRRFTANETASQKPIVPDKKKTEESEFKTLPVSSESNANLKEGTKDLKPHFNEETHPKKKDEVTKHDTQEKPKKETKSEPEINITVTRVYAGSYATSEEAVAAQKKLMQADPSVTPFIKNRNGKYTLQAGSFYDADKADALVKKLNSDGFQAKKVTDK